MAANESLLRRVRAALAARGDVEEKKMFGGIAFMVDGKMCVTVGKDRIMCRIDPAVHEAVVEQGGCEAMVMGGREMRGYVHVSASALRSPAAINRWLRLALDYNPRAPRRNGR